MKSAMNQICSLLNPDNTMTVNRLLAHAVGIPAAVVYTALISKYVYYEQNELIAEDGWFNSTVSDLEESTTLGIKAQRSAIRTLEETGLIRCEMKGMPAMRYFSCAMMPMLFSYRSKKDRQGWTRYAAIWQPVRQNAGQTRFITGIVKLLNNFSTLKMLKREIPAVEFSTAIC